MLKFVESCVESLNLKGIIFLKMFCVTLVCLFLNYNLLSSLWLRSTETKDWDFKVAPIFLHFWQPLLKGLHSRDFTQTLLEKMFGELKQCVREPGLRSQYLINWITEILKTNMEASECLRDPSPIKVVGD